MKKQIYLILLILITGLSACDTTTISDMDGSVDERLDKVMNSYIDELATAPNGWIMSISTSQGVFRFHMSFTKDNKVTMYTDNMSYPELKTKPGVFTYNVRALQRPTISFDTYSYVAIICDPDDNISGGSGNVGLKTDFEFEVAEYKDDTFILTGRINRVYTWLTKATAAEKTAVLNGDLQNLLSRIANYKSGLYLYSEIGGFKAAVMLNHRSVNVSYVNKENALVEVTSESYVEMNGDITMRTPIVIGDNSITGLKWTSGSSEYSLSVEKTGGQPQPVVIKTQPGPVIPANQYIGCEDIKPYKEMASLVSMYGANITMETNPIGFHIAKTHANLKPYGGLAQMSVVFGYTQMGLPKIAILPVFGKYQAGYTFPITISEDGSEITLAANFTYEDDVAGNGEFLYKQKLTTAFIDYLKGKTFKIDWSSVQFGSYQMVKLVNKADPKAEFHGALL